MARQKTQLQIAADRVAIISAAVADFEAHLESAQEAYDKAWIEYQAAYRDLEDTKSLLRAQREKLLREKRSVAQVMQASEGYYEAQLSTCEDTPEKVRNW